MKLAVQLVLLPGRTVTDQAKWASDHGVEGIELGMKPVADLMSAADRIADRVPVCSVCGNCDATGTPRFDFLHPKPAKRRAAIDASKALLAFCGQVGAAGQIVPPIFGPPLVPDLSPVHDPVALEDMLMAAALEELGPFAAGHGTCLFLEPLNRYEQHYLRRQVDGVRAIERSGVEGVRLLSDLFHMHIEETDTPAALRAAGRHVGHLHLADNTRLEPGTGDIDFTAAFTALADIGFEGFMAYECGISGEGDAQRGENLARSLEKMRASIADARQAART